MSQVIHWAKVTKPVPLGGLGVVDADNAMVHVLIGAPTLVRVGGGGFVPVRLANFSKEKITLPRNENIGIFRESVQEPEAERVLTVSDVAHPFTDEDIISHFDVSQIAQHKLVALKIAVRAYSGVRGPT